YDQPALTEEDICAPLQPTGLDAPSRDGDLFAQLAAGCVFDADPVAGRGDIEEVDGTERGREHIFTTTIDGNAPLEIERDGTTARMPMAGTETVLDDSSPSVGDAMEVPAPGSPPPTDMQGALERQEPLPLLEGLDDLDGLGGDPIAGLGLEGDEP
ncbi:MAG TPA: hypothetical protein VFG22_10265, partial [Polyangiales bacterium]|nr:hypothetical protein [Polyangiales bacterium]